ncbi:signal recognition particle-docking protein FtsY [Candidatus Woesearchaeota archaeon]|nr:signal recognition particle-docking protein FtsY [Candidatus Woesearchaeota archaeon]
MFGFLKDKLKGALAKLTKKVEEAPEEVVEVPKSEEKKPVEEKIEKKVEKKLESVKKPKVEKAPKPAKLKVETKPEPKSVEPKPAPQVEPVELPEPEKKGFFSRLKETIVGKDEVESPKVEPERPKVETKVEMAKPETKVEKEPKVEPAKEKPEKGFFSRLTEKITTKKISVEQFDELFWDLELALLENNVAVEVIEKIKGDLKSALIDKPVPRGRVEETIAQSLHDSLESLFEVPSINLLERAKQKKPFVICFVGVNGSGKTTSIAKLTKYLQSNGLSVVLAAADTFRAAAIDQLQLHADNLGVKLVRHDYGADPAAVAFDAIKHAEASKKDVVLIDTAGRLHSNVNLVDEMKKIVRIAKPDVKIFVGESITGNDCIEQAKKFDEAIGIDGIILAKADVDEKGGAAISVSYVTKKPILFLGMGQEYKDLQPFDKEKLLASIGL